MLNTNIKKYDDRIYFNATFNNNNLSPPYTDQIIELDQTQNESIVDVPSDFWLTINRFSIPALALPIVQIPIQPNTAEFGFNTDPNQSILSFTFEWGANVSQFYLEFANANLANSPPPVPPVGEEWPHTSYYFVFEYEHMMGMLNRCLLDAFNNLAATPPGSEAPYFELDAQTGIMSLICQRAFYDSSLPIPIRLYMNRAMFKYISSFDIIKQAASATLGRDFLFVINDVPGNYYDPPNLAPVVPPDYFKIDGVGDNYLQNWYTFKQIVFTTGTIPIKFENVTFNDLFNDTNSDLDKTPILTDFEPIFSDIGDARSVIQYFPQGPYRLIDLNSEVPLRRIQISVFWRDEYNILRKLQIPWGTLATLKLLFIRKDTQN